MPKKITKKHGRDSKYYRTRVKTPEGGFKDIYGRTMVERDEKVSAYLNSITVDQTVPPDQLYFFEYATGWYRRREPHMSDRMRKMYKHEINKVICPVIGQKLIREVTSDDLLAVMATRGKMARSTQQKTVLVLKQIFDDALEAGVIEKLPTRRLKASGKASPRKRALTEVQQRTLLEAVKGLSVEPCVMLGLYTGLRREEICGLRWDCVELTGDAPHLTVRRACRWPNNGQAEVTEILKTSAAARSVPIPSPLLTYLQDLKAKQEARLQELEKKEQGSAPDIRTLYVYCRDDGGALSSTSFRRRWETIKYRSTASGRALGTKVRNKKYSITLDVYPTPHILRHTYITRLILGGMDLKRVQYLAGHADPKVTLQIYTDLMGHQPEDLIADVNAIFT